MVNAATNGTNPLKSPTSIKSARTPSFSREGILGSAQKARNLSQTSEPRSETALNGSMKPGADDDSNPLKRRATDNGVDYPRRRATIAVRSLIYSSAVMLSSAFPKLPSPPLNADAC